MQRVRTIGGVIATLFQPGGNWPGVCWASTLPASSSSDSSRPPMLVVTVLAAACSSKQRYQ
jgi:hypothetical protein